MNLRETLQALADGKKIRNKTWVDGHYIYLKNELIVDENGHEFSLSFIVVKKWEIYEEPKKPIESLNKALDKFMKSSGNFNLDTIDIINKIIEYLNEKENERETNQ